ncbi:hypothetical protein [Piscinibacter sp. XHJ-5]|uniref:hypothetical protein n=1 Tax=Piscinibacter sp. XHJ-5 TaxID=3037797 RepID=UPI002452A966|nr:hypothetical protein [Piscinibacter sp. XHJ-5]
MHGKEVALVAVHGVADQGPGETAKSIVDLLVSSAPDGVQYRATDSTRLTLSVDPLQPRPPAQRRPSASPSSSERGMWKSLRQSMLSDIHRPAQACGDDAVSLPALASDALRIRPLPADHDVGIAVTDYLMRKHIDNGAEPEAYETEQSTLEWKDEASGTTGRVDVFELYWADLSRLSGQLPRILTEAATLMFRLCRLGRDTVDLAAAQLAEREGRARRHVVAWWITATFQRLLDWVFVHVMVLLMAQLAMLGILVLLLGLMRAYPGLALVAERGLVGVAALGLLLYGWYLLPTRKRRAAALVAAAVLTGLALSSWVATAWLAMCILGALLTLAYDRGLAIADDRFPLVQAVGRLMWGVVLCSIAVWTVALIPRQGVAADASPLLMGVLTPRAWVEPEWNLLIRGALASTELVLAAVKYTWVVMGFMLVPWLLAGFVAARESQSLSRASVATGRLGFGVSAGGFFALVMTLWAFFHVPLAAAVGDLRYDPWLFDIEFVTRASELLERRYQASTAAFSAVVVVLVVFAVYVVLAVVPSLLAELKVLVNRRLDRFRRNVPAAREKAARAAQNRTTELGSWLTWWYRHLDRWMSVVVTIGVIAGVVVALTYIFEAWPGPLLGLQRDMEDAARAFSQKGLRPLAFGATGITASLVVFGNLLSRALPALRAPLDVALDVDNHFREFPRTAIPRARIFSRYAALLEHLQREGYRHIVIVAHSQGTVITADLLRFLRTDRNGKLAESPSRPWISEVSEPLPDLQLLTVGSPLRQLYAARFPFLYRWSIAKPKHRSGPAPADIGVRRWLNAFCSGDYVGRWLWADHAPDVTGDVGEPMDGTVAEPQLGRCSTYESFSPLPPDFAKLGELTQVEACLGLGAHTHYFEPGERLVAALVHHLVAEASVPRKDARSSMDRRPADVEWQASGEEACAEDGG